MKINRRLFKLLTQFHLLEVLIFSVECNKHLKFFKTEKLPIRFLLSSYFPMDKMVTLIKRFLIIWIRMLLIKPVLPFIHLGLDLIMMALWWTESATLEMETFTLLRTLLKLTSSLLMLLVGFFQWLHKKFK